MARTTDHDSSPIFNAASEWCDQCLIAGKALLWKDRKVWSTTNLRQFKACFTDKPDTAKDKNFEAKFKAQLAPENEDVARLACELLFVYFLYPSSVRRPRKSGLIYELASWKGIEVDGKAPCFDCFDNGIGNPGLAYNTGRANELTYLARFVIAVTGVPAAERAGLLQEHASAAGVVPLRP